MPKLDLSGVAQRNSTSPFGLVSVFKSLVISFGFTFVVFAVFALLLTYTGLPDSTIGTVVFVTMVIAVMLAGFMSARNATSRGWLNGALGGLLYVAILYMLGALFVTGFVFDKYVLSLLAVGFLSGAVGGIVGINMKRK